MTLILDAKKITKRFTSPANLGLEILKGIDLAVPSQKSIAIVGRSGEGKTTLLHILGTIDEATSGDLFISGKEVLKSKTDAIRNEHIGFIFQAFHLLSDSTVLENLLMPAKIARKDTRKGTYCYDRARELLEMVGLENRLDFSTAKLSGGEKQRVAIARAFMNDPDIIFADEPTGNLDHETAHDIQDLLLNSVHKVGKALVLVTHNLQLAKLLDACYELENGILHQV